MKLFSLKPDSTMKTRHICGIILLAGLTAVSCYEDKGDYDYHEINEVTISLQKTMDVTVPHEGSVTVTLSPEITQSMRDGDEGLVCEWRKREGTDSFVWKVCGDEKILKVSVPSRSTDNLYYRFAAKDSETGVTTYAEISLRMVNPLENAWFVLQDVDGRTVVGAVDGSGETAAIHRDIYAYLKGRRSADRGHATGDPGQSGPPARSVRPGSFGHLPADERRWRHVRFEDYG